jgi:ribosomal protein S18 acetylase RimI-like enzyme
LAIDRYSLEWETLDVERHDVESFLFAQNEQIFRQYLVEQAYRDQANGVKRTRLLVYEGEVLGFYTSCCSKLRVDHSEAQNVNGRGDDLFVPALEIAYLAVDVRYRSTADKIGTMILDEILGYAYDLSQDVGCRYVFLRAINEEWLIRWYWSNGFDITTLPGYSSNDYVVPMRYAIPQGIVILEEDIEAEAGI